MVERVTPENRLASTGTRRSAVDLAMGREFRDTTPSFFSHLNSGNTPPHQMSASRYNLAVLLGISFACTGCQVYDNPAAGLHGEGYAVANPMFIPSVDPDFLWEQIVDAVDNHFQIRREARVRRIGDVLLDGRLDTYLTDGSTILEPWRKDSTHGFEKMHSTLQSTGRVATVQVAPVQGGFMIDVIVEKFVENVPRPQDATSSRKYSSHGEMGTDVNATGEDTGNATDLAASDTPPWIAIGRDASLEQKILADIRSRVTKPS